MEKMDLKILWFVLVGVLYTAYFMLEGFDLGAGILLPFIGKNDTERRMVINTIGSHWDGNEVLFCSPLLLFLFNSSRT
jgi:cytochrome bd ubiquinol oxidase subunit II